MWATPMNIVSVNQELVVETSQFAPAQQLYDHYYLPKINLNTDERWTCNLLDTISTPQNEKIYFFVKYQMNEQ